MSAIGLRAVEPDDLPVFFDHHVDPVATAMAAVEPRDWPTFVEHWTKTVLNQGMVRAVVADGAAAGYVVAFERDGLWEVGYWLGRGFWGRGIASQALHAFLAECPARPLHAMVASSNIGSICVARNAGFVETGRRTADDGIEEVVMKLD